MTQRRRISMIENPAEAVKRMAKMQIECEELRAKMSALEARTRREDYRTVFQNFHCSPAEGRGMPYGSEQVIITEPGARSYYYHLRHMQSEDQSATKPEVQLEEDSPCGPMRVDKEVAVPARRVSLVEQCEKTRKKKILPDDNTYRSLVYLDLYYQR